MCGDKFNHALTCPLRFICITLGALFSFPLSSQKAFGLWTSYGLGADHPWLSFLAGATGGGDR